MCVSHLVQIVTYFLARVFVQLFHPRHSLRVLRRPRVSTGGGARAELEESREPRQRFPAGKWCSHLYNLSHALEFKDLKSSIHQ